MSHDKRALQKQAQETFIYLAGNIRLGVKMSSSTTAQKKDPKQEIKGAIGDSEKLLELLALYNLPLKKEEPKGRFSGVPKRNKVV